MIEIIELNDETFWSALDQASPSPPIDSIARWLDLKSDLDIRITSSNFEMISKRFCHYMVTLSQNGVDTQVGHGRSIYPEIALHKAFSEAIERMTVLRHYSGRPQAFPSAHLKLSRTGELQRSSVTHECHPFEIRSSNGWAAHFNLQQAIKNALFEAIERHTLQIGFWQSGLKFLNFQKTQTWRDFTFHFSNADVGFADLYAAVCAIEHPSFPGLFFGHQIGTRQNFERSSEHAAIEAFQLTESYLLDRNVTSRIDAINFKFAECDRYTTEIRDGRPKAKIKFLEHVANVDFSVLAFDVGRTFGMGFSFFVVKVYSDLLVPLFLEDQARGNVFEWLNNRANKVGVNCGNLSQTPFI